MNPKKELLWSIWVYPILRRRRATSGGSKAQTSRTIPRGDVEKCKPLRKLRQVLDAL